MEDQRPSDSTSVPRSRWKDRKAKAPGIHRANATASPAAPSAAEVHAARVGRPLRTPVSSSAGHPFSSAPNAASAPSARGLRTPASSAATATAVTIRS